MGVAAHHLREAARFSGSWENCNRIQPGNWVSLAEEVTLSPPGPNTMGVGGGQGWPLSDLLLPPNRPCGHPAAPTDHTEYNYSVQGERSGRFFPRGSCPALMGRPGLRESQVPGSTGQPQGRSCWTGGPGGPGAMGRLMQEARSQVKAGTLLGAHGARGLGS